MHTIGKAKIGILLILCIAVFSLSGCSMLAGRAAQLSKLTHQESSLIKEETTEIFRCFNENDKEGLKNLFCEEIRNEENLDDQISEAMEYLKGHINDSEIPYSASGGQSTENGKVVIWSLMPRIKYIQTLEEVVSENNNGYDVISHYYQIDYEWVYRNDGDKSQEGLHRIIITLLNVDEFSIGRSLH